MESRGFPVNYELFKMRKDLERLRIDCQNFLEDTRKETRLLREAQLLNQTHVTPPLNTPPISADQTPATEQEQKRWRFTTGENGQIPPAIALKAAANHDLLLAIQEEIEQRIAEEKE